MGDVDGHDFHGNQWTQGRGGKDDKGDKPKKSERDERTPGSLTKKGGMVVSGGDVVHVGDKVTYTLTSALTDKDVGTGEGKVKEITGQGVGVKMANGDINVFDPNDITEGHVGIDGDKHGAVAFMQDRMEGQLKSDQAVFAAFFSGDLKVTASAARVDALERVVLALGAELLTPSL